MSEFGAIDNPVRAILGVWKFVKKPESLSRAWSTPGHLLHLVLSGSYRLRANNREYRVKPGDMIYYHECEEVFSDGNTEPVVFYSVSFLSSEFKPIPYDKRVSPSNKKIRDSFKKLHESSQEKSPDKARFGMFLALFEILEELGKIRREHEPPEKSRERNGWWEAEDLIRRGKKFRASIDDICEMSGMSRSTARRKCLEATGESPSSRLRKIRMEEAAALLRFSSMSVGGTAEYLGYGRAHEFSREFSGYHGFPPVALVRDREKNRKGGLT